MSLYDLDFVKCFPNNIKKIKKALTSISGTHALNTQNVDNFIQNQLTQMRKDAAQDLIDNTHYITLQDVFDIVEKLVLKVYENDFSKYENLIMYVGEKNKSFYFISIIALYFIQKHKLRTPTHFIKTIDDYILIKCGGNPIFIFDDVSYSGSQLATMLGNIYYEHVIKQQQTPPNLYIQLVALNSYSLFKLEQVPTKRIGKKNINLEFTKTPFQINYIPERLYTPIIDKIGFERYFKMALFFSPFSALDLVPVVSIYLDHKLADDVSTFTNTLMYGPIVPDIDFEIIHENDATPPTHELEFYKTLRGNNIDEFQKTFYRVLEEVNKDKSTSSSKLSFYPLIQNCKSDLVVEKLKSFPVEKDIYKTYLMFVLPINCLENDDTCAFSSSWIYNIKNSISSKIINMRKKITNENCPFAWYKKANLGEQCTTQHYSFMKSSKTRKQRYSSRNSKTRKQLYSSRNSKTRKQRYSL